MNDDASFDRISELFEGARIRSGAARDAFVAAEPNPAIRAEVEALLEEHDRASPLDANTPGIAAVGLANELLYNANDIPEMIGPYRIVSVIGEGGMGIIYEAQQTDPDRSVALKVIKLGMDTKQVMTRFEAERRALALMDHPNIATVFDAGATETGRPYFAMELVRGVSVVEYCDREQLDPRARLRLFCDVCRAIQHAHQKGVIHRDIKPTNVLVSEHDGLPMPKVIDFGIAKATDTRLTVDSLVTAHGQAIGTPAYMSPEQAAMGNANIDTRSDIYSLGVLLYELLTGTTPFAPEELQKRSVSEMMRLLQDVEPDKPSTRLSSLGDQQADVASHRGADPASLRTVVTGDLDCIVMRCLEKAPERRYETSSALADDIERFLRDEPIEARPHSTGYKLQKFVRRNRGRVVAGVALVLVLIAGVIGTTSGLVWALRAQARSERAAAAESAAKLDAQASAAQAKEDAEIAEELSAFFVLDVLSAVDPARTSDRELTVREALMLASANIDGRFEDRPEVEARIRNALGYLLERLGAFTEAEPHFRRLWTLAQQTDGEKSVEAARCLHGVVGNLARQGRDQEAIELTRLELDVLRGLDGDDAQAWRTRANGNLGALYVRVGRVAEAAPILEESLITKREQFGDRHATTLSALNNLASIYNDIGDHDRALELAQESYIGRRETLGDGDPRTLNALNTLATTRIRLEQYEEALATLKSAEEAAAQRLGADHPSVVDVASSIATAYALCDRDDDAEAAFRAALARQRVTDPEVTQQRTTKILSGLANTLARRGRLDEAHELSAEAVVAACRILPPVSGERAEYHRDHAAILTQRGAFDEAEEALQAAWDAARDALPSLRRSIIERVLELQDQRFNADPTYDRETHSAIWRERLAALSPGA